MEKLQGFLTTVKDSSISPSFYKEKLSRTLPSSSCYYFLKLTAVATIITVVLVLWKINIVLLNLPNLTSLPYVIDELPDFQLTIDQDRIAKLDRELPFAIPTPSKLGYIYYEHDRHIPNLILFRDPPNEAVIPIKFCRDNDAFIVVMRDTVMWCPSYITGEPTHDDDPSVISLHQALRNQPQKISINKTAIKEGVESFLMEIEGSLATWVLNFRFLCLVINVLVLGLAFVGHVLYWMSIVFAFAVSVWFLSLITSCCCGKQGLPFGTLFQICIHTITPSVFYFAITKSVSASGLLISWLWTMVLVFYYLNRREHAD